MITDSGAPFFARSIFGAIYPLFASLRSILWRENVYIASEDYFRISGKDEV